MAKFILEVPEGTTQCEHCSFADSEICSSAIWAEEGFDCSKYDFSDLEIEKWTDAHPNPNTIKKVFEFALEKTNFLIADNLDSIDWDKLIKQAMRE